MLGVFFFTNLRLFHFKTRTSSARISDKTQVLSRYKLKILMVSDDFISLFLIFIQVSMLHTLCSDLVKSKLRSDFA